MKKAILFLSLFVSTVSFAQQNTILLIADDVSPDYFGFYSNNDTSITPVLSNLAYNGVVFDHAWAYPVCSPTRASMLTGRYGFRTGMGHVVAGPSTNQLSTAETTIASILRNNAPIQYSTACVGKWHLHSQGGNLNNPSIMGYQYYSGNFAGGITDYYNYQKIVNGTVDTSTTYATTETINDAISWLDTIPTNQPFFLWVGFNAPHSPWHKPPNNLISNPNLPGTPGHISANRSEYFKAAIDALDTETGRLLQYLNTKGLLDSTNIIFIGDNGSPGQVTKNPVNNRSKGTIYNYGVEVPMFISGPAVINQGRRTTKMVSTVDLFATIADLSNVTNWNPNNVVQDSRSLMPIIKNQSPVIRGYQFSELFGQSASNDGKSIRNQDYHLIKFDSAGTQEFYNISNDTFETNNLLQSTSTMSNTDIANYHLLCDSLNSLVGGIGCLPLSSKGLDDRINNFSIFPNPANDVLYIQSPHETSTITIYDLVGKQLITETAHAIKQVDISDLNCGIYILNINNLHTLLFVKE